MEKHAEKEERKERKERKEKKERKKKANLLLIESKERSLKFVHSFILSQHKEERERKKEREGEDDLFICDRSN